MTRFAIITAVAALAVSGSVQAKSHDQGAADGNQPVPPGAAAGLVDDGQKNGQRGDAAKAAKGDNRTTPISRPGQNKDAPE